MAKAEDELLAPTIKAIKAAREAVHQSMEEAAREVHVNREAWWKWETGKNEMSLTAWELYLIKTGQREVP